MIYLNLSYFDRTKGPESLGAVPNKLEEDVEECINTLLDLSEFIVLKFFIYISSEHLKTANLYFQIPSKWARGKQEMLLLSVVLTEEKFNHLYLFRQVLERLGTQIQQTKDAYKACYADEMYVELAEIEKVQKKRSELLAFLEKSLPEVQQIVQNAADLPLDSELLAVDANLQDEFVIFSPDESVAVATQEIIADPRVLIGVVLEGKTLLGTVIEDDILHKVLLAKKDPEGLTVRDIMTAPQPIDANTPIGEVITRMVAEGVPACPIVQNGEFLGVFTVFDAAGHHQNVLELIGEQLMELSPEKLQDLKQMRIKLWSYVRNIAGNKDISKK